MNKTVDVKSLSKPDLLKHALNLQIRLQHADSTAIANRVNPAHVRVGMLIAPGVNVYGTREAIDMLKGIVNA